MPTASETATETPTALPTDTETPTLQPSETATVTETLTATTSFSTSPSPTGTATSEYIDLIDNDNIVVEPASYQPPIANRPAFTYSSGVYFTLFSQLNASLTPNFYSHNVTQARRPKWSPNGTRIAYECDFNGNIRDICIGTPQEANGSISIPNIQRLFVDLPTCTNNLSFQYELDTLLPSIAAPVWSPDGQWIAYSAVKEGEPGIYTRNVTLHNPPEIKIFGSNSLPGELYPNYKIVPQVDWGEDGYIYFSVEEQGIPFDTSTQNDALEGIYRINYLPGSGGFGLQQVLSLEQARIQDAQVNSMNQVSVSPDGVIAFTSDPLVFSNKKVFTYDPISEDLHYSRGKAYSPRWLPVVDEESFEYQLAVIQVDLTTVPKIYVSPNPFVWNTFTVMTVNNPMPENSSRCTSTWLTIDAPPFTQLQPAGEATATAVAATQTAVVALTQQAQATQQATPGGPCTLTSPPDIGTQFLAGGLAAHEGESVPTRQSTAHSILEHVHEGFLLPIGMTYQKAYSLVATGQKRTQTVFWDEYIADINVVTWLNINTSVLVTWSQTAQVGQEFAPHLPQLTGAVAPGGLSGGIVTIVDGLGIQQSYIFLGTTGYGFTRTLGTGIPRPLNITGELIGSDVAFFCNLTTHTPGRKFTIFTSFPA